MPAKLIVQKRNSMYTDKTKIIVEMLKIFLKLSELILMKKSTNPHK
jgi:hypothetical protein